MACINSDVQFIQSELNFYFVYANTYMILSSGTQEI